MKIRCLLVDDEHFALALLEKYVQQVADLEWVASCKHPGKAAEILARESIDLLFLDIQMPALSGLKLLRDLPEKPVTIFTTAYPQHALEAYDLDAVDYLLKPYPFERFERALAKAREVLQHRKNADHPSGHLMVRADRRLVKVPYRSIRYIEGWKEYLKIHTESTVIITLESLSKLEQELPETHFLRVHKSFIVGTMYVDQLEGDHLHIGADRIPVARARKQQVKSQLSGKDDTG